MADLSFVQCQSCGGIYAPIQADGTEYYHACPPRRVVGYTAAPTKADPAAVKPVYVAIDNPRNENIAGLDESGQAVIVAEGSGVTDVVDPAVITALTTPLEAQ